ncbi:DinB family protein [Parvibaculum sp.]|uniref:DinB family protein n=1 Tax=Parvibaculum sp. TaxID=2024848 RepID=UPI0027303620|nr:DinB family protein [Parvibaculum sp.]MDP1626354.1 DinB family protein [Parvibaculum sp.]MDP2151255.1 DinB family protein [Parvibaculum sp.]MDP3327096.1 DinB family protein [Parvibaculum sp.]
MSGYAPIAVELSRYNQWQNEKLYGIVAQLPPGEASRERGMFFGDIVATLDHILMVDTHLFGYIQGVAPPPFDPKRRIETEFDNLRAARVGLDARLRLVCESAVAVWFDEPIVMPNGRRLPRSFWWAQLFNHATHHRSQVTSELSHMGIDYGNTDMPYNPLTQFPAP